MLGISTSSVSDVGLELADLGEREAAVGGGAGDFDGGVTGERVGEHLANHDGVVNDEDANGRHGAERLSAFPGARPDSRWVA